MVRSGAEAKGTENCSLDMRDLLAIRIAFGDKICDAIERSATHLSKKLKGHFSRTTQCIQPKVPYDSYQDTIIRLDVGSALELVDLLFPLASRRIESVLSVSPPSGHRLSGSEAFLGPGNTNLTCSSEIGMEDKVGYQDASLITCYRFCVLHVARSVYSGNAISFWR
jgi:hypothetical protein